MTNTNKTLATLDKNQLAMFNSLSGKRLLQMEHGNQNMAVKQAAAIKAACR